MTRIITSILALSLVSLSGTALGHGEHDDENLVARFSVYEFSGENSAKIFLCIPNTEQYRVRDVKLYFKDKERARIHATIQRLDQKGSWLQLRLGVFDLDLSDTDLDIDISFESHLGEWIARESYILSTLIADLETQELFQDSEPYSCESPSKSRSGVRHLSYPISM